MNGVELARRKAADLHDQAVTRGRDPWSPYVFAVAEANRRNLDVEKAAKGAAVLNNGRASYIPDEHLIIHENVGTLFEQAFLVVHELGHAELGDDSANEPLVEFDAARPAEPSPVGIDRVVDYGRRQRREVQMDLFAREFLLPRHVVRRLHVEDNLSASAIAQRLGAPFDVVAQQLLDSLLLPQIDNDDTAGTAEHPLNPEQEAAAKHRGVAFLLEAGPGTGKTQTLIARVEDLIAEGVDPRRILLLTFSNKAAGEMADRIAFKNKEAAAAMWIGTFHAFGLDIIRRFHAELGLPKDPQMMDRTEAVELLEKELPRLGLFHYRNIYDPTQIIADILAAISRAKDEVVDEKRYAELAEMMRLSATAEDATKDAAKAIEIARVYEAYETLKHQLHRIDFGDLVSMPVRLLEGNEAIRTQLRNQYDHVLIDEYQDVNRSSIRLITALRGAGENLWAVGDAKQSIYRFRGASSFNMTRFGHHDFPSGRRGRLKQNYRSTSEIVDAFSAFSISMKVGDLDSGLHAERGSRGEKPELRTTTQVDQQTVALADAIEEMRQCGHSYKDQAVLCTANDKLSILGQDLERMGVPVLFLGSLFERAEAKELFALLSLLTDRRAMGLVRIACLPDFQMSLQDVATILEHLRDDSAVPLGWLQTPELFAGLSFDGRSALASLAQVLGGFKESDLPWDVLATILLDRTRLAARIFESTDIANRTRGLAIWQLMNFIRIQPSGLGLPIVRLLDRVRRLVRLGDDRELRQLPEAAQMIDAVRLMTIHGSKGLEFPLVHLPGMNADTLPRTLRQPACPPPDGMIGGGIASSREQLCEEHAEEQECLFYVALSRARDRLVLYAPKEKANGHNRPLSPFLDRLGESLMRRHITTTRALPPAPEVCCIELSVDGGMRFQSQQIALYESCPRRFFYTHVLRIGGRRVTSAFMQMHEAVRAVLKEVIAGDLAITNDKELTEQVAKSFADHGLDGHGYADELKSHATGMLRYFQSNRDGLTPERPVVLSLTIEGEEIIVYPDEVLVRSDGSRVLRSVRTGHQRSSEGDDVGAAAVLLAAQAAYTNVTVELVHLADESTQQLTLTTKKLQSRRDKLVRFLQNIRLGKFPMEPSSHTCPGCPAFFVCGQTPSGKLKKKFD